MAVIEIDESTYPQQLAEKQQILGELFKEFNPPALETFESPTSHYRMRCEFRIWHDEGSSYYAMFDPADRRTPIKVTSFPVAGKLINELMPKMLEEVLACPELRERIFTIEFLTSQKGDALVTFIYHRKLGEDWVVEAKRLEEKYNIHMIGRSRKQKVVVSRDYINESFNVNGRDYQYKQYENSFSQPNANMCEKMLNWAVSKSDGLSMGKDGQQKDMLELYCGNGNFTLPFAQNFNKVCATEISKISVRSAQENAEQNNIENVDVHKISSEDFSDAWLNRHSKEVQALKDDEEKELPKNHKKLNKIDIEQYDFSSVFVDPPRAGLDDDTVELVRHFDHILYISCNPNTLADNVKALSSTHEVKEFALFDQFPYTHHMEAGVLLIKKEL
jgi:tRNA (uracil-5-)-methyltransferase